MASLPIAKVASLLVRTLAKPVATRLKKEAAIHPILSRASQRIGQTIHSISSRINVTTAGLKFVGVKPLPKEEALQKGINFLSECFIFSVALTVVVVESVRSDHLASLKKQKEADEIRKKNEILENRFLKIEELLEEIENSLPEDSKRRLHEVRKVKMETREENIKKEREKAENALEEANESQTRKIPINTRRAARLRKARDISKSKNDEDNSAVEPRFDKS